MTVRCERMLTAILVLLVFVAATPQQKPVVIPGLGEMIEVSLINVDVVVTDRQGRRMRGLPKEAFEIYENDKLQAISNFAEYGQPDTERQAATLDVPAAREAPTQTRNVVLFLEPFKLPGIKVDPFVDSLKSLVRETIRKGDSTSIIEYDQKLKVVLAQTDDVRAIDAALDEFGKKCRAPYNDPTVAVAEEAQALGQFESGRAAMAAAHGVKAGPQSGGDLELMPARLAALQASLQMSQRVAAINSTIQSMAASEGRKILILSPHRLGEFAGAEFFFAMGFDSVPPDVRPDFDNKPAIKSIARNANAAGVTLYPVFAPGIDEVSAYPDAPDTASPMMMNEMAGLTVLAEETGGVAESGTANIAKMMPAVAEDTNAYYSLAYRVTSRRADAVRRVTVKMKAPGLSARTRSEYVEKSDDARMRDRVRAGLLLDLPTSAIPIEVKAGKLKPQGKKSLVPIQIYIPVASLSSVPDQRKNNGAFSVYVVSGASNGDVSEVTRQTQMFELTDVQIAKAAAGHFTYSVEVLVNASAERIAIGVLDEVSKSYALERIPIER